MKKLLLIVCIAFVAVGSYWLLQRNEEPLQPPRIQSETTQNQATQTVDRPAVKGTPNRLIIPKIDVNADVESVGMDQQGRMDVPKDEDNVSWYNLGFLPGQQGSAVLAGHFDSRSGGPAVFYNLAELKKGDEITASYPDGSTYTFIVTDSQEYAFDEVPLEEIFNSQDQSRLNLITCDGVFDQATRNYSRRLVVYSVLKP